MFGYVHQKTEIRTLDKDGNEVSRESRYTVHPSSDKENQALTQAGRIESSGVDRQDEKDEKDEKDKTVGTTGRSSGWFWR
ncbi:hypothetical protein M406DRAFT_320230 [Cryphonectria parasitica EP155]|uniref:Uncharacterized protein n=1 Tax=Cryphonectria parasitica (strain ATCC 38755 / EP155) TaxID=660469 RepID=A0A9P5CU65_CRYP1|nr:uncharacterized protein M406DRAFT_320230 [Cryphonectria parasitica EP155]KAF3770166.1 hypothetical protein M406DRAFT_320230 [Cryphonectria parasitica EP155]